MCISNTVSNVIGDGLEVRQAPNAVLMKRDNQNNGCLGDIQLFNISTDSSVVII